LYNLKYRFNIGRGKKGLMLLDCDKCTSNGVCFYSKIKSSVTKRNWNHLKNTKTLKKDEIIFNEGETPKNFYIVCSGKVSITKKSINGEKMILSIRTPGHMFGYGCLCKEGNYIATAKTIINTTISYFSKEKWIEILKSDFDFSLEIMKLFCTEISNLQTRLCMMAWQNAEEKVVNALINHISFVTQNDPNPILSIKRSEIAEICGLRVETVVRTLQKLEDKKIIKRDGQKIKILSLSKLLEINSNYL
jgi:CRP-like cAMP-binding protein